MKNQGTAATPAGIAIGVGYSVESAFRTGAAYEGLWPQEHPSPSAPTVDPTIPTGTRTIMAYVDDVNRFAESDETNNRLSQPITVS